MRDREFTQKVGETVRRLRQKANLSQEDFADKCDLHRTYIGSVERAEKAITLESAKRIADALEIKLSEFFAQMGE